MMCWSLLVLGCADFAYLAKASAIGGTSEQWWALRRRCEVEVFSLAAVATAVGFEAISEWKVRSENGETEKRRFGVDRMAYSKLSNNMQFVSGVQ